MEIIIKTPIFNEWKIEINFKGENISIKKKELSKEKKNNGSK
jgi:hypothetical protein